ncbi:hypothetical protein [Methanobrevibacter sp.]|uniref:hypothetical protein n=1 Tax=Methanobrevibacter sp. TaxID=66852 RepID=UPI00386894E8
MFNKKYFLILLLLIVSICALSTVSAADNATDAMATSEANDTISIDEASVDDVAIGENSDENEKLDSSHETSELSVDNSGEVLSEAPPSSIYRVVLNDEYEIPAHDVGKITIYRCPSPSYMPYEPFHYYIRVIDTNYKIHYEREIQGTNNYTEGYVTYTIVKSKNTIEPGTYILAFVNYADNNVLDTAIIKVRGDATISPGDYNANYMSGAKMTATIKDSVDGKPLSALSVKVVFTKGKTQITKYYIPDANGQISFVPPVGVGTWNVQFNPGESHIRGSASKTITVKKSKVSVKAKKVVEYKGFKAKLKATVKSNGKNVNEGKVQFKINGKKYNVNVKNGVATKKIKLKKIKKYKYTAKYLGNANLYKSKVSKAKAIMKKRQKVKITFKKPVVYTGQTKKIVVKIKSRGKYVKGGWLFIKSKVGIDKVKVKKGKVTLYAYGSLADHYKGTNGIDKFYKKKVTKKYWLKYKPASHKYYAKKVNYKATSKFKCDLCGKKSTHYHYSYGYFVVYKYKIVVS